jgi:GT2 family glycosyltransferase
MSSASPLAEASGAAVSQGAGQRIDVSVVVFCPDWHVLRETFASLYAALCWQGDYLGSLFVINNGPDTDADALKSLALECGFTASNTKHLSGHGNVGYGTGHNLAIREGRSEFHLVLNPDVVLQEPCLAAALHYFRQAPTCVLLSPWCKPETPNAPAHLCKAKPSVLVLALRGLGFGGNQVLFHKQLSDYCLGDVIPSESQNPYSGVPIAGGAFMLCRRAALNSVNGFDEGFFLYFEDFDLSLRIRQFGSIDYVPAVQVRHFGGNASRKGFKHVRMFAASASRFFRKHGIRWT